MICRASENEVGILSLNSFILLLFWNYSEWSLLPVRIAERVEIKRRRLFRLHNPSAILLLNMVRVIPNRLCAVRERDVSSVVEIIFEKSRAALSEVSELDFLNVNLDRIVRPVPVDDETEIRFVEKVRRSAYIVQGRGFDYSVLVSWLLCRVSHQDNQNVVQLSERRQFIELL